MPEEITGLRDQAEMLYWNSQTETGTQGNCPGMVSIRM